jgi:hypothetical protein
LPASFARAQPSGSRPSRPSKGLPYQGGKMIDVLINVDDPGAFTTPWSATQQFRRVPYNWTEDICAENNFEFLKYEVAPLPQASKADF